MQYVRDAAGRVVSKVFADGRTVGIGYDATGNVTSVTPPSRPAWQLAHSARNELTQVTPPAVSGSGPTTFAYDLDRQPTAFVRGDGSGASLAYDSGAGARRALTAGGVPTSADTFAYDTAGRLIGIAAAGGVTVTYTWDGSLPTRITWSGAVAGDVALTYDSSLRLASESVNGGNTTAFAYDADDLPTSAGAATITRAAASGLPIAISVGNATTALTHNGFGEVASATTSVGGNVLLATTWTRDKLGRITRRVETLGGVTTTWDYAYAASGQLASVARNGAAFEQYAYDANGNRTSTNVGGVVETATFDVQDRILTHGATRFVHDGAGALRSRTTGGQTTTLQYDPLGNLLSVVPAAGDTVSYVVDGRGRRVPRQGCGGVVKRFLYAGALRVAAELDGAGNLVNRFVYGGGRVPIYMTRAGATYLFATDAVGSVRLVVDATTGAVAQRIDYDAFGNVVLDTNPGFQPFGFAGGLYDPDTGLVRIGARDYDAKTGRWTTKDPRGLGGLDTNLYRYAANDPVNLVDPTGASAWDTAVGFVQQGQVEAYALMNPAIGLSILADSVNRMLLESSGYAVPQASLEDLVAGRAYPSPLVDYSSEDYAKGTFAAACVGFVAGIAEGNPGALDKARHLLRALGTKLDDALTRLFTRPETAQKLAKPDVLGDLLKRTIKDVGGDPDKGIERVLGEQRGGGPSSGSGVGLWTDEY
ncbi:MAG: RHS repeat-associated core domain-containing protein [Betaproteobacteria bacterium]|nr:RHS repeat-associated core domain-containing protein [Betaproteobacteria bacterium]